jgi:hypothetical protein
VADPNEVSQFIVEVAAESGPDRDSQLIAEVLAATGPDQISQLVAQLFQTTGPDQISQITIELLRGPEVIPPSSNPASTFTVGAGLGNNYSIALQLSDSGIELRDKVVKDPRVTGKFTSAKLKVYGYGPKEDINVADIERGTNPKATLFIDDSTQVQQSALLKVNVKNAMTHTARLEGIWDGQGIPDRLDEIVYQVARQGIRR